MKVIIKNNKKQEYKQKLLKIKEIVIADDVVKVSEKTGLNKYTIYNTISALQVAHNDIIYNSLKNVIKKRVEKTSKILSDN
jgi:hypothetical protein